MRQKRKNQSKKGPRPQAKFIPPTDPKPVQKLPKICVICKEPAKYKCPKCLAFYCKVECFKIHKEKCVPKINRNKQRPAQRIEVYSNDQVEAEVANFFKHM